MDVVTCVYYLIYLIFLKYIFGNLHEQYFLIDRILGGGGTQIYRTVQS